MDGSKWTAPVREAGQCTLLVIDDDEIARYILRKVLRDTSVVLLEAATGKEGILAARASRPDALLLDYTLEDGETAHDVLDLIKAEPDLRGIPVIMLTAHTPSAEEWKQLALETAALLTKDDLSGPDPKGKLRDALRKVGLPDVRL